MNKFYLVQRGNWNTTINKENAKDTNFTGMDGLIRLDYMGSAEFEWGAIPKAYRRILAEIDQYSVVVTPFKNINGVPLCLYCRIDRAKETIQAIQSYINKPWHLKEWIHLNDHMARADHNSIRENFWWAIENGIDWIAFFGVQDRIDIFNAVIKNSYENWWMKKTEEERELDIKEAFNSIW